MALGVSHPFANCRLGAAIDACMVSLALPWTMNVVWARTRDVVGRARGASGQRIAARAARPCAPRVGELPVASRFGVARRASTSVDATLRNPNLLLSEGMERWLNSLSLKWAGANISASRLLASRIDLPCRTARFARSHRRIQTIRARFGKHHMEQNRIVDC